MENATDALIMAGSVLLLIIALTVSISSFSNLRVQVDEIVSYRDQIQMTKDGDEYLGYIKSTGEEGSDLRTVGVETIISALRRERKEQYTIYICLKDIINFEPSISENIKLTGDKLDRIKQKYLNVQEVLYFTLAEGKSIYIEDDDVIETLYSKLSDEKFVEYIGVYQNATAEGVSDANKETYKIITFVQK